MLSCFPDGLRLLLSVLYHPPLPVNGVRSVHLPSVGERPVHEGGHVLLCG